MIVLKHVTKHFGGTSVLSDVSLTIDPGEFVCVTGPSGAGKSTLIHLLIGAETVTKGTVEVDGVDLGAVPPGAMQLYRRRVGIVFQDGKLLKHRTVAENVAFPLEVCGYGDVAIRKRTLAVLKRMELLGKANAFPQQLSGGERARAAIARAIVHEPVILIADEPTGNVDPSQSLSILKLLRDIHAAGTTVILATHDAGLVDAVQGRVIRLERGKIVRDSVGGYDAEPAKAAPRDPAYVPMRSPQSKDDASGKIKITPIGLW